MKKICFLFACLTFVSVLPSFAHKIIVNDNNDRIVYSRSSFAPDDTKYDIDEPEQVQEEQGMHEVSYVRKSDLNSDYDRYLLELLGADFRTELAGTRWYYPQETFEEPVQEEVNEEVATEFVEGGEQENPATLSAYQAHLESMKRDSREAADYYMVDMEKDPDNLIPSGIYR